MAGSAVDLYSEYGFVHMFVMIEEEGAIVGITVSEEVGFLHFVKVVASFACAGEDAYGGGGFC